MPRVQARVVPRDQATSIRVPLQKRSYYVCNNPDHLANQCNAKKEKSQGRSRQSAARRVVGSSEEPSQLEDVLDQDVDQIPLD